MKPETSGMNPFIGIGAGVATGVAGGIGQRRRENRQMNNQRRLMDIQFGNQQALNQQAHDLNFEMWQKTNYGAQMEELKKAGLNPALLYGQGGQGGSTGGQGGGSAASGNAPQQMPMEIGAAVQAAQTAANIKLMQSQADKNEAEASSIRGEEGTVGASQIKGNLAEALNKASLTELNKLGFEIGNATKEDQIDNAHFQVENLIKRNNLTDAQAELATIQTTATGVRMQLDKANIKLSEQQAKKLANDIILGWKELDAKLAGLQIQNEGNRLRALEGKTDLQKIRQDFILGTLGKEIDLMKLNVEQQKIFVSLFNGVLSSARGPRYKAQSDSPLSDKAKRALNN